MQETIAKESPRRRIARRVGAAGVALAAVVTLGACKATGGGYLDEPAPGGPVGVVFDGQAQFGFNFTCEIETAKKRAVIRGTITYHDDPSTLAPKGIKLNGTVDPLFIPNTTNCADAGTDIFQDQFAGLSVAEFHGDYRSQDTTLPGQGRFIVDVFDQGEPGSPAFSDGDYLDIRLVTGPYTPYNRAGYIEGGNIQVED
jgi:hypothetical protein